MGGSRLVRPSLGEGGGETGLFCYLPASEFEFLKRASLAGDR